MKVACPQKIDFFPIRTEPHVNVFSSKLACFMFKSKHGEWLRWGSRNCLDPLFSTHVQTTEETELQASGSNPASWWLVNSPEAAGPRGMICTLCYLGTFYFKKNMRCNILNLSSMTGRPKLGKQETLLLSFLSDVSEPAIFHSHPLAVFLSPPNGKSETSAMAKPNPYVFELFWRPPVLIMSHCEVIWLGIKDLSDCFTLFPPVAQV